MKSIHKIALHPPGTGKSCFRILRQRQQQKFPLPLDKHTNGMITSKHTDSM